VHAFRREVVIIKASTIGLAMAGLLLLGVSAAAAVKPGDTITSDNAAAVQDLVSPGNYLLVKQGMQMKIVPTGRLEWPPPYKAATEKYASQVSLNPQGELLNYVAGLPFPSIDPNDPTAATKVMWNFSYRPQYTDDVDIREVEISSYGPGGGDPIEQFAIGHVAFYFNTGRTEVKPTPTDAEGLGPGIRYRFGAFPFEQPAEIEGFGFVRYRYIDPNHEDDAWSYMPGRRRIHRLAANVLSDTMQPTSKLNNGGGTFVNNLDADSAFGFAAKVEDFNYRLLGLKPMLATVHAENIPATPCQADKNRTVCPENWEMRQLYVIEATAKPVSWTQKIGNDGLTIPKRTLYIDSEAWFLTASDQYDRDGKLWKTIATFNAYRDRAVPDARAAIYPFKRSFQTALVDEDLQSGYSTVEYMPGHQTNDHECWYINMGIVTKAFLDPNRMALTGDR
jgi:hypothetical protein